MKNEELLSQERLLMVLRYDQSTGLFTRLTGPAKGKLAGRTSLTTYVDIHVDGHRYAAHRLAWLYVHGEWPRHTINHINAVKTDNRISNLEDVTPSENTKHAYRLRLRSAAGEANGRAKLTVRAVHEIRQASLSNRELAAIYGVDRTSIRDVRSGRYWSHA